MIAPPLLTFACLALAFPLAVMISGSDSEAWTLIGDNDRSRFKPLPLAIERVMGCLPCDPVYRKLPLRQLMGIGLTLLIELAIFLRVFAVHLCATAVSSGIPTLPDDLRNLNDSPYP